MTITAYDNRRAYAGDGSTAVFAFPPPFTANSDLIVVLKAADGTLARKLVAIDYTVAGAGDPAGGTVTMLAPPRIGTTLTIYRDVPLTQPVMLLDGGPLPATTANRAFDRSIMQKQRLREMIDGAPRLRDGDAWGDGVIDAGGNKMGNIADAAAPNDAANLKQLLGVATGNLDFTSEAIPYSRGEPGSAHRTVQDKFREMALSLKDFGAKGDGLTDDTLPILAWLDACRGERKAGYVPAGRYIVSKQIIFDTTPAHGTGFLLFGDGIQQSIFQSSLAAKVAPAFAVVALGANKNQFYGKVTDLGFQSLTDGACLAIGSHDFSDAINGLTLDVYVANGHNSANNVSLELNYVCNSHITATCNSAGSGVNGAAIKLRQTTFSDVRGSYANARVGMLLAEGYNFGNTFTSLDFEEVDHCIEVANVQSTRNSWVGGQFGYRGTGAIKAVAGAQNIAINPNIAPSHGASYAPFTAKSEAVGFSVWRGSDEGSGFQVETMQGVASDLFLKAGPWSVAMRLGSDGTGRFANYGIDQAQLYEAAGPNGTHQFWNNNKRTLVLSAGGLNMDAGRAYYLDGLQVLGPRLAGWTAGAGPSNKGAFSAYGGTAMGGGYSQGQAQATNDAVRDASQRVLALEQALRAHGLIT